MRLVVADEAEADLEDIFDYIALDSIRNARKYVSALRQKMKRLGRYPRIHPLRNDLPPGMRAAAHGSHLVLYTVDTKVVNIARVVHGAMDLEGVIKP